jgi:hypothetical protein
LASEFAQPALAESAQAVAGVAEMIAVYFRHMGQTAQGYGPTGFVGLAVAQNKSDLFWVIDEFCDPYRVEVQTARKGGMCVHLTETGDDDDEDPERSNWETSGMLPDPFHTYEKWRKPKW